MTDGRPTRTSAIRSASTSTSRQSLDHPFFDERRPQLVGEGNDACEVGGFVAHLNSRAAFRLADHLIRHPVEELSEFITRNPVPGFVHTQQKRRFLASCLGRGQPDPSCRQSLADLREFLAWGNQVKKVRSVRDKLDAKSGFECLGKRVTDPNSSPIPIEKAVRVMPSYDCEGPRRSQTAAEHPAYVKEAIDQAGWPGKHGTVQCVEVFPERDVDGIEKRRVFGGRYSCKATGEKQAGAVEVHANSSFTRVSRNALHLGVIEEFPSQPADRRLNRDDS